MSLEGSERTIREICQRALRKAVPSEKERRETLRFSEDLTERLFEKLETVSIDAEVQVQGSVAKDTWLAGEKDIDLFILLPRGSQMEGLLRVLEVSKELAGNNYLEAYAEHPYIEAKIGGYTVDFVPCFEIGSAEEAISSVDRTPLHTRYIKEHIDSRTRGEVRLIKRFMRGIDTYGAEIKVGGFSGYLCELLTLYYGSFIEVLKAASNWRIREVIDCECYYTGREDGARSIFQDEALIVIDPVDKGRNVASAVRESKLNEFILAAREFLKHPSLRFFYPSMVKAFSYKRLIRAIHLKDSNFIFLKFGGIRAVPDVLWGQLYRSQRALRNLIRLYDFDVIRDDVWSDGETVNVFIFELNTRFLSSVKKHPGPPIEKREDCERFLEKHLVAEQTLSGPRIEGDRLIVETRREYTDAAVLLKEKLKDGGRNIGVATFVSQVMADSLEVLVNREIKDLYLSNSDFAKFLTEYIKGRPRWLG